MTNSQLTNDQQRTAYIFPALTARRARVPPLVIGNRSFVISTRELTPEFVNHAANKRTA